MSKQVKIVELQSAILTFRLWANSGDCPDWAITIVLGVCDVLENIISARDWAIKED